MAGELLSVTIADSTPIDPQGGIGVDGNGWVAVCVLSGITNIAGTLDASKLLLQVQDPGYTANGTPTTVNRTIRGSTYLHRTHPNGDEPLITTDATNLTLYIAFSELIYAGTTIVSAELESGFYDGSAVGAAGSINNSSTLAYKKPFGAWINFNGDTAESDDVYVEFVAACRTARNGQQVACIEFYADDGVTTGPSVFVNAPTISTLITKGQPPECFAATVDLTGQAYGGFTKVNAKIYPHIGDDYTDLDVDGYAWPTSLPLTPLRVFCDGDDNYGGAYAYVDGVGAGTPAVSDNPVTAKANPYATLTAAFTAVRAWNNANKGHNDFGGAKIRFINDTASPVTYSIATSSGNFAGTGRCIVEADPLATGEVILEATAQTSQANNTLWRKVTHLSGASNYNLLGYSTSGSPATTVYFDDCAMDNSLNKNGLGWYSYRYFRNYTLKGGNASDLFVNGLGPTDKALALFAGVVSEDRDSHPRDDGSTGWPLAIIGCNLPDYAILNSGVAVGNHGRMIVNNVARQLSLNSTIANTIDWGVANIQNVYEYKSGVNVICMSAFADGDLTTIDNYIDYHNTAPGDRSSRLYNDNVSTQVAPSGVNKAGVSKYSIYDNYNIKDDRFNLGDGSGSVGNWSYEYSVGNVGNVSMFGNTRRTAIELPQNDSSDQYLGSYWQPSSSPNLLAEGYSQTELMDMFVNWTTTPRASPTVGGDYRLTAAATPMLNRVPAGMAVLAFDLDGNPRKNDDSGAAGAYEFFAALPTLTPDPVALGFVISSPNLESIPVLTPDNIALTFSLSNPELIERPPLGADDLALAFTISATTLNPLETLAVNDIALTFAVSEPALSDIAPLNADDLSLEFSISSPSLNQYAFAGTSKIVFIKG